MPKLAGFQLHMRKIIVIFILGILLILAIIIYLRFTKPTSTSVDPEVLGQVSAIKLKINQEGLYRVAFSDLGWDENISELSLTHKNQPIPYELQSSPNGNALIFYGETSQSPYTPDNYYVLRQSPADKLLITPMAASKPEPSPPQSIIHTIHLEENLLYVPKADGGSPWQWVKIVAPQTHSLEVDLPQLAGGPGTVRVNLWGTTTAPTTPDHHVRIKINGQTLSEVSWDGQTWQFLEAEIPTGVLIEGTNTVEIEATGDVEARLDIINLDWLEIDYPKSADQIKAQEIFRTPEGSVQLTGSKGPLTIYEIINPTEISRLQFPESTSKSLVFQGNPELRYLAVSPDGYLSPAQILPLTTDPDLRTQPGASYLAIGQPELLTPLDPLLQARIAQGLDSLSVPLEAIYDQFNGGLPEPEAIQAFLSYAAANWEHPPQYVLLVGDASYDYYGYQTPPDTNFLPTFLVPTVYGGETGSDVRMAQLDGDLTPDLAIGRVPARSIEQIETFISKTLDYEQNSGEATWNRSVMAVADGQEASFKEDANRFLEQFSDEYQTELIAPEAGAQGVNQQIDAEIDAGKLLTAYFGHGSVNMWGKDSLFTTEDSASLENGSDLSIFLNFTCLTGLFTHPTEESLAESLLFNPKGGAVAVLAPTSPTLPGDQTFLSNALVAGLLQDDLPRLGDITLYAWQQVPTQSPGTTDVMQTFLLFGDPALLVP